MKDLILFSLFLFAAAMAVKADMERAGVTGDTFWQMATPHAVVTATR